MTPSLLIDVTQIPDKLAGMAAVSNGLAAALLAFLIPLSIVEQNVRALDAKQAPNYGGIFARTVAVVLCLIGYRRLFFFIVKASQLLSLAVLSEQQWGTFLLEAFKAPDSSYPALARLLHPVHSFQDGLLFLSSLIALLARDLVVMLQGCFLSLLFAFGPLALACGVNERTGHVARGWVTNVVQVALWSFFLRLVVRVWLTLDPIAPNSGAGLGDDFIGILTVNVTFLVLVLGTPLLAARLLSGENIAAFGEAAFGAVQTLYLARGMRAASFVSGQVESFKRFREAHPDVKWPLYRHPVLGTATAAYDHLFGRRKPTAAGGGK